MRFESISMADLESIKRRNAQYEWGELHQHVRLLSLWLLILGTLLILLGIALPALIFAGKISLPYTPSTRILISVGIFILGLLLGSGIITLSRVLSIFVDVERSTRYAMNIWFILEKRDLAEGTESGEAGVPPDNEEPSCL
ncbi:MAG: hypothetical protein LUP99_01155 [Methanomicrobiales archaeon]|nr:hypothetical protein [Methanomicrobiales archaeon]